MKKPNIFYRMFFPNPDPVIETVGDWDITKYGIRLNKARANLCKVGVHRRDLYVTEDRICYEYCPNCGRRY